MQICYNVMYMSYQLSTRSPWRTIISIIIILLLLAGAFIAGVQVSGKGSLSDAISIFDGQVLNKPAVSKDVDFALFWEVWQTLKRDYVDQDKLTEKKLFYGALRGLVGATEDPYSVFMNPEEAKSFEEDLSGSFEGIGAEIGFRNDILTIIAPLEEMPAVKAGIRAGDKIFAIDGKNAANLSVEAAVKLIRGPKDTQVTLTIVRDKEPKPIEIKITRATVIVKSVKYSYDEAKGIFTIKISSFNGDTDALFNEAVQQALIKKPQGIILDLRNNPGGYLESAVSIASDWVKEGIIVTEQFGDDKKIEHKSQGTGRLANIPTVILVNQGSASASEIVAGALKDYAKATLVGEKTFGKGSVQILRQLEDGSVIKITTAKWLTPNGNNINEEGIEPEKIVERSAEDREQNKDPQTEAAIQILLHPLK